ncbi:hypothetical protein TBLA_0H02920 [Henningerozyma blattae CBS 6284]|uniref:TRIP4/RQT4 C2HC5-type zinc finger domain-containing protein n=1 Tax=Henningerozyma blattae (strain ATCC 34711 / CBS 6284 / DSM 70876 / NBRC 10599 / NRRL Y-10934 / UCD 77-7) TaxID=1071380 RepID=I2H874_HENB6|nr:hypothetical protein TBLA_0H02920 [Tetrapisispora blattae CBS 6284]CCH62576.1 hypothetical protein TBLA_0H02920 [Tetrapisispora blattae CBS 6284]
MTRSQAIEYAAKIIPNIVPIEESDARVLCNGIVSNDWELEGHDAISAKFFDILGQTDMAFEFVIEFNRLLSEKDTHKTESAKILPTTNKTNHSQNNLKNSKESPNIYDKNSKSTMEKGQNNTAKRESSLTTKNSNSESDGYTISQKFQGSKTKLNNSTRSAKTKKARSLKEIEDVVKMLELEEEGGDIKNYICNCQGNRHPVFDAAPNCLLCGKIICAREGLHMKSCSFCGEELISSKERMMILELLKKEKEDINNNLNKTNLNDSDKSKKKKKKEKIYMMSTAMGKNEFQKSDKQLMKMEKDLERERRRKMVLEGESIPHEQSVENLSSTADTHDPNVDPDLVAAQERLDKLLYFQDTSAERTKIIDNASDFSMSDNGNIWGSARERALMLKKQQRNLKKWEKDERERNGRKDKYTVSLNIGKDGKVTMTESEKQRKPITESDIEDDELLETISDEEELSALREIRALKHEVSLDKQSESALLQNKVWDFEENLKQFSAPVYIGSTPVETNQDIDVADDNNCSKKGLAQNPDKLKSRIQIGASQDDTLEESVLAVY